MITTDTTKHLADLAKTVLEEPKPQQLLAHLIQRTLSEIDARGAILGVIEREGFLDLQGTFGYEDKLVDPYLRIPLWTPMPITDAARTGEVIVFHSPEAVIAKYPHLKETQRADIAVTTCLPIFFRNTVIGAIGITSLKSPAKGFENAEMVAGIAALCGLYIRNLIANKAEPVRDYNSATKSLSERQKQIINLFKEDLTTDQMAERLKYSSSTIKQDIIKIYALFGVNNRSAVIKLAEKAGMV